MNHFSPFGFISGNQHWPALPFHQWKSTYMTLHLWTQIVGKIRLVQTPWTNHSWHTALYVTSRGLTTSPVPYGARTFQIDFDLIDHELCISTSDGQSRMMILSLRPVAQFYDEMFTKLDELDLSLKINTMPNELIAPIPLDKDYEHAVYDAEHANRFFHALVQADRVMKKFRSRFIGKCSPVHFFWGSFDLAVSRFSGRTAPEHPGGVPHLPDWVTREAYSHEVCSCGFWPGSDLRPQAVFYSYIYPEPSGYSAAKIDPDGAQYDSQLKEFILPYDIVRESASPDETLLTFLQSSYEVAANLGDWNRAKLEKEFW